MGKMKKLSKLTAGVLSFALAMGAAGTFPPCVSRNQALASATGYASETAYEVTIPDAYINRIYTYDDVEDLSQASILRLTVIPKKTDYYDYYDAIEISMYSPYIRSNTLDELDKELYEKWDSTIRYCDMFGQDDIVTLKFTTYDKEEADALQSPCWSVSACKSGKHSDYPSLHAKRNERR